MFHPSRARLRIAAAFALLGLVATGCSDDSGSDSASTTAVTSNPTQGTFTLLTYNVAGLPQEISGENPKEHIPQISYLLDEYDVVLTQEDFDWFGDLAKDFDVVNYHDRLRAQAHHKYRSKPHPGPDAVDLPQDRRTELQIGDGLGFLSNFPMDDEKRIPWTKCFGGASEGAADCLAMKGFSVQTMTLAKGVTVDVYNLHLEAGGGEEDQAVQAEDVEQLTDYVLANSKGHAVILAGDTNLHTDDEHPDGSNGADTKLWKGFLEATGLTDACDAMACEDTGRIDKVAFRSNDDVELAASGYEVPKGFIDAEGDGLSDHDPVIVTFGWRAR